MGERDFPTIGWLTDSPLAEAIPVLVRYLAAILRAAFKSALSEKPHLRHSKADCDRLLLRAVCPQEEHACEVCAGLISATVRPFSSALYETND